MIAVREEHVMHGLKRQKGMRGESARHLPGGVSGKEAELPALVALHHGEIVHQRHYWLCVGRQMQVP